MREREADTDDLKWGQLQRETLPLAVVYAHTVRNLELHRDYYNSTLTIGLLFDKRALSPRHCQKAWSE